MKLISLLLLGLTFHNANAMPGESRLFCKESDGGTISNIGYSAEIFKRSLSKTIEVTVYPPCSACKPITFADILETEYGGSSGNGFAYADKNDPYIFFLELAVNSAWHHGNHLASFQFGKDAFSAVCWGAVPILR